MDDGAAAAANKTTQELSKEGEKHLESTIGSAFQILSSMNDELCNPSLWTNPNSAPTAPVTTHAAVINGGMSNGHHSSSNGDVVLAEPSTLAHHIDIANGVLEEARFRYKSSVASLRSIITTITNIEKKKAEASDMDASGSGSPDDQAEIENLQEQAATLREELLERNEYLKKLMDQLRILINDVTVWQSPCSL